MIKLLTSFAITLSFSQSLTADTTVYRDGVISISEGIVISQNVGTYFKNIQLAANSNGNFQVIAAEPRSLVSIDSVAIIILESFPVQISIVVEGFKSVPCVDLEPVAVSRYNNVFTVLLAETELDSGESCIAVIDPFEIVIPLEVYGLKAGVYIVTVNGMEAQFSLTVDNSL